MSNIKFITFTDVHISMMNPSSRVGSYVDDIMNKLEQIREIGKKNKVDFFLFGGDLFNLKAPTRNPHELNSLLINLFKSYPGPVYAAEGNHDLRGDSYETFPEQPLNVIYASGALIPARDNIKKKKKELSYRVRSFEFSEELEADSKPKANKDVDLNICILHVYSSIKGGMFHNVKLHSYEEISKLGDDIFLLGHFHKDQGIERLSFAGKEKIFINIGSISRGSISTDDIDRVPKISLVSVDKCDDGNLNIDTEIIPLDVKPSEEVFDLDTHEREKKENKEAEEFVDKLKEEMSEVSKNDDIREEVEKMNIDKEVMSKVRFFLEEAYSTKKDIED